MIIYSRPPLDGPCTTAGIGMIVANTLLVGNTQGVASTAEDMGVPINKRVAD